MRMMKNVWRGFGLGTAIFFAAKISLLAAAPAATVAASFHFAGGARLAGDTNFTLLKKIWNLPESPDFRGAALKKLAQASADFLAPKTFSGKSDFTLVRPLLDDLLSAESIARLSAPGKGQPGFVLAVKLDKTRAQIWQENIARLLAGWNFGKPEKSKCESFSGQLWKKANSFQFIQAADWVVIGSGEELGPLQTDFLRAIEKEGRPVAPLTTNFFEADIDWPRLPGWLPLESWPVKLARTEIKISGKADRILTVARVAYPEALGWKSEPWQIPTTAIRDPLVSFTAGEGLARFVNESKNMASIGFDPLAHQIFTWAQADIPFQTFAAVPVKNAPEVLLNVSTKLPPLYNPELKQNNNGELRWLSDQYTLAWQGLQIVVPHLSALKEKAGEYLFLAIFPPSKNKTPAPDELFAQVRGRTNLVYYDWELTGRRLDQWRFLSQLLPVLPTSKAMPIPAAVNAAPKKKATDTPMHSSFIAKEKWISAVVPLLENTITEITASGPNELTLVRRSHLGLNSVELLLLTDQFGGPALTQTNLPPRASPSQPGGSGPGQKKG